MASARFAWGIDVGNRALKAIKLVREGDRLRVDDFEVIEYEQVLSSAGDNRDALIQKAVADLISRHGLRGGAVAVGVSGQSSFARFIKLPPVEPKKIPEIVKFEAIQQIPFPLDEVEWSYQLFQDPQSPDVEVGIFAMRRELINQQIRVFTESDLNVQVVQMNPLAVYNGMYYDGRIEGTTMIIDMGAENTDLIIADGETVWLRSIPIGGNNFTEALVKAFKLNFSKAEEMKRTASTSKYARQIFQAMRPVFADLVAEVQRSIGFYASTHRDSRITRIIASGGTFRLPGLQKYLQQNLQLEVDVLESFTAGAPADGKQAATFNENLLSMAASYGLAVQAMGDAKITSSLLPQYIRRARMWKENVKWFGAAAALFALGTGLAYGRWYMDNNKGDSERATEARSSVQQVLAEATKLDSDWSTIESAGTAERTQIQNIESLLSYRNMWNDLLQDIRTSLPQPQPEVASGDPKQIIKIPRPDRRVIIIDSLSSRYEKDLSQLLAQPGDIWTRYLPDPTQPPGAQTANTLQNFTPPGAGSTDASAAAPTGTPQRGFMITVMCTTPNKDGFRFVSSTMVKALAALQPGPNLKREYYVARASVVSATPIRNSETRKRELESVAQQFKSGQPTGGGGYAGPTDMPGEYPGAYPGAGMMPPVYAPPAGMPTYSPGPAGPASQENPYVDRLTGEDVLGDLEVKVGLVVLLDPPAASPPAQTAAQPTANAQ